MINIISFHVNLSFKYMRYISYWEWKNKNKNKIIKLQHNTFITILQK